MTSTKDASTGASFAPTEAKEELQLRRTLTSGDPLVAGDERLNVGTGTVSVELLDKEKTGPSTFELTLKETAEYPYVNDPGGMPMGESYKRRVTVKDTDTGWRILQNEVPAGDWPLIEGATDFESSNPSRPSSSEPKKTSTASPTKPKPQMTTATVSRSGAVNYALRYALSYNDSYRHMDQDCTNFVSQSLRAGGFRLRNVGSDETSLWAWWYNRYWNDEWSHSWSVAQFNYRFHQTTNRGRIVGHYWQVAVGDIMYADWSGNGRQDHVVIFTGNSRSSGLRISAHTNNRRNVDASWWMSLGKEDDRTVDYDYFHMDYGEF